MSEITAAEALERARAAARAAQEAARAAETYADTAAAALQAGGEATLSAIGAGVSGIDPLVFRFSIFVLAIFVGYYVVWSVTPALHTPLMSVTNAISSVIVVGALLAVGVDFASASAAGDVGWARWLGFAALMMASVNIFGGFLVTQRMLGMYKKRERS